MGDGPSAEAVIRLATQHLADATVGNYDGKFAQFVRFCAAETPPLCPLPASAATCAKFVSHLAERRRADGSWAVQPDSAQPYLSSINRVHVDVLGWAEGPARGPLLVAVRHGWEQERADSSERLRDQRLPLPAGVASAALDAGLALLRSDAPLSSQQLVDLRAHTFVALGFLLMGRADTDASLAADDVSVSSSGDLAVRLRHEKGKRRRRERRVLTFPGGPLADLVTLVSGFDAARQAVSSDKSARSAAAGSFWRLPSDPGVWASSSDVCTTWLRHVCDRLGFSPPAGHFWSSHSLRKGAASAASALTVSLDKICFLGGWSIKSAVVHDYVDPTVLPTAHGRRFFGWCLPAFAGL